MYINQIKWEAYGLTEVSTPATSRTQENLEQYDTRYTSYTYLLGDNWDDDRLKRSDSRRQHQTLVIPVAHHAHAQSPDHQKQTTTKANHNYECHDLRSPTI